MTTIVLCESAYGNTEAIGEMDAPPAGAIRPPGRSIP
jgi:hypothetical protein